MHPGGDKTVLARWKKRPDRHGQDDSGCSRPLSQRRGEAASCDDAICFPVPTVWLSVASFALPLPPHAYVALWCQVRASFVWKKHEDDMVHFASSFDIFLLEVHAPSRYPRETKATAISTREVTPTTPRACFTFASGRTRRPDQS